MHLTANVVKLRPRVKSNLCAATVNPRSASWLISSRSKVLPEYFLATNRERGIKSSINCMRSASLAIVPSSLAGRDNTDSLDLRVGTGVNCLPECSRKAVAPGTASAACSKSMCASCRLLGLVTSAMPWIKFLDGISDMVRIVG